MKVAAFPLTQLSYKETLAVTCGQQHILLTQSKVRLHTVPSGSNVVLYFSGVSKKYENLQWFHGGQLTVPLFVLHCGMYRQLEYMKAVASSLMFHCSFSCIAALFNLLCYWTSVCGSFYVQDLVPLLMLFIVLTTSPVRLSQCCDITLSHPIRPGGLASSIADQNLRISKEWTFNIPDSYMNYSFLYGNFYGVLLSSKVN